jgi:uncharacterized phage-associated protein
MGALRYTFNNRKATQAAAFILRQAEGNGIVLTKGPLVKMLYAADRRQLKRIGKPITGDRLASMDHGPVLSKILDYLDGDVVDFYWSRHISKAKTDTHRVQLLAPVPDDLLSEKEKEALTMAFTFFKDMSWEEIQDYFHAHFKEWEDPKGTSKPIAYELLLKSANKTVAFIEDVKCQQAEEALLKKIFA